MMAAHDLRDMSQFDLDDWQYVCQWCQGDLRLGERHPDTPQIDVPTICANCGALRESGGWYQGYRYALAYPTGAPHGDD